MAKYSAKCTVYLEIESDYPDGIGEAQREVGYLIDSLRFRNDERLITISRAVNVEILPDNKLRESPGECGDQLWYGDVCLNNGGC